MLASQALAQHAVPRHTDCRLNQYYSCPCLLLLLLLAGEHMDQFESFETKRFVSRLLGRGDVSGLMDKIQVCGWGPDSSSLTVFDEQRCCNPHCVAEHT
jgi:hypothetical protein